MKKFYIPPLLLCFALLNAQELPKCINVTGTSELIVSADQIHFTIKIKIVDTTVEQSKRTNDKCLSELLTILKSMDIHSNDIDVSPLTLGKNYEFTNRERKQNGYYTEVTVTFLLKDLSKYYSLTNKLASNNSFEISNADFSISDYETQHKRAYEKALIAAREKAEYMSKVLGAKLGEVLEIDENNIYQNYSSPINTINSFSNDSSTSTEHSGKVIIKRSVRVKYALK